MKLAKFRGVVLQAFFVACAPYVTAQTSPEFVRTVDVSAQLMSSHTVGTSHTGSAQKPAKSPPAVIWLKPAQASAAKLTPPATFTLLQKNKMFSPHLLVVPVGSSVMFPNADPFFHNVFSLFDGRRFDLGLYEAGSTRSVVFSREGVSYIFCNIHSEMSAVVLSLATPYSSVADGQGNFRIKDVPTGDYDLHVWIEGQRQNALESLSRRVRISAKSVGIGTSTAFDLGAIHADLLESAKHLNKFGRPYELESNPIY